MGTTSRSLPFGNNAFNTHTHTHRDNLRKHSTKHFWLSKNPRQLVIRQNKQSMSDANRRLSAAQGAETRKHTHTQRERERHTHAHTHTHQHKHTHTHTHACSIPYSTLQTVSVHLEHCYQSYLQVQQCKLQRKPGPDTNTHNTQTGHMQRLVLRAHYNLGSAKSSHSISEHLGVTSH